MDSPPFAADAVLRVPECRENGFSSKADEARAAR
jgi:hypothetical protein